MEFRWPPQGLPFALCLTKRWNSIALVAKPCQTWQPSLSNYGGESSGHSWTMTHRCYYYINIVFMYFYAMHVLCLHLVNSSCTHDWQLPIRSNGSFTLHGTGNGNGTGTGNGSGVFCSHCSETGSGTGSRNLFSARLHVLETALFHPRGVIYVVLCNWSNDVMSLIVN